jgi:hypothetical protein
MTIKLGYVYNPPNYKIFPSTSKWPSCPHRHLTLKYQHKIYDRAVTAVWNGLTFYGVLVIVIKTS